MQKNTALRSHFLSNLISILYDVSITEKGKQLFHAFAKTNFVKVII